MSGELGYACGRRTNTDGARRKRYAQRVKNLLRPRVRKATIVRLLSLMRPRERIEMAAKTSKTATAKSTGKAATKSTRGRVGSARAPAPAESVAARLPQVTAAEVVAAKEKFEQGILVRGEAAKAGKPLPAGATHEILGKRRDGTPILKRRRFSLK
jgi:hypothetical protein